MFFELTICYKKKSTIILNNYIEFEKYNEIIFYVVSLNSLRCMKSQLVHIPSMRDAFKQRMKLLTKYLIEVKNLQVYKKLIRSILLFYGFFFLHFVVFFFLYYSYFSPSSCIAYFYVNVNVDVKIDVDVDVAIVQRVWWWQRLIDC